MPRHRVTACRACSPTLTPCALLTWRRYERLHPEVPVVRNYEDMWMVAKMQRMQKRAQEIQEWQDAQREAKAKEAAAPAGVEEVAAQ